MEPARAIYTLLGACILPLLPVRLWWRGRREPGYRQHIGERFGSYRPDGARLAGPVYWVHAVSLGETRAAAPLVERLLVEHPDVPVLMTHMTATGRDAGRALFGDKIMQAWLPYDLPFAVRAFYARFRPLAGLLVETELWPNLIGEAQAFGTPLFLVNARLSAASARGYARFPWLSRPMFGRLAGVAAQSSEDAARLASLGAPPPAVVGNIKFDVTIAEEMIELGKGLRLRFGPSRPVWIAGSTREGEEALILDAMARRPLSRETLLVIVPRHPQRFAAVADMLRARGMPFIRRSETTGAPVPCDIGVVLGDSMGEMPAYYCAADIAFVGGSLLPFGGQNLIEPLAVGTPVVLGPHTYNFAEAASSAIAAGAAWRVADADALIAALAELLSDEGRQASMREAARRFHAEHRGAADRLWQWLAPRLPSRGRINREAAG